MVIRILKESSEAAKEYLSNHGYDIADIIEYVTERITTDEDYPGIALAYDSEYSDEYSKKEVKDFAKDFVTEYILPGIVSIGPDYEYDYSELFDDIIKKEELQIQELERDFEDLVELQQQDWQDDIDSMNREYRRNKL